MRAFKVRDKYERIYKWNFVCEQLYTDYPRLESSKTKKKDLEAHLCNKFFLNL